MTAIPARVAGVREVIAVCPRPDATVMLAALEAGVDRMFRIGGAQAIAALAYGTETIPRVDKIVGPGQCLRGRRQGSRLARLRDRLLRGPERDRGRLIERQSGLDRGGPARPGGARPRRARHPADAVATACRRGREARSSGNSLPQDRHESSLARNGAIVVTRTMTEAIALSQRIAPEHVVCDDDKVAARLTTAGTVFVGDYSAQALGDYSSGSNHVLPTSGAARGRGGLSAADFVRVSTVQRITRAGVRAIGPAAVALAEAEGLTGHARSVRDAAAIREGRAMTAMYQKLAMPAEGLRLHLNENTGGCSQAVLDAIGGLTREMAAVYPDYTDATAATAALLGVPPSYVVLVNGLDEGIFAAALATLRGPASIPARVPDCRSRFRHVCGLVAQGGGTGRRSSARTGFAFPAGRRDCGDHPGDADRLPHDAAQSDRVADPARGCHRDRAAPLRMRSIFVDEAYIDFGGQTLIEQPLLDRYPNLVVGRTFSKAYGLAALRAGALVATPATLERIRECVPPYSINIAAVARDPGGDE